MQHVATALGWASPHTGPRLDRQPVRRHSYLAGQCEGRIWRRTSRQEVRRVLLAARRYELVGRQAGRREGPLGHVAIEVLELLGNLVSYQSGRLEPALVTIMRKVRRSRDAVVRALAALRAHGFLDWLRRFEPLEREGPGPQIRQCSNAYRLVLPPRAARLLGRWGQEAPVPDDVVQVRKERSDTAEAHKAALPLGDLPAFVVDDGPLGQVLAALGRLVEQRESASRTEPQTKDFI